MKKKKDIVKKLIINNPIKEKLADLLHEKIGVAFSKDELDKILNEGEKRYKEQVPPGFGDIKKPITDRYGDLIFWKEILKKNKEIATPILLITGDKKEDWYLKELGFTIGPRPELIAEFINEKDNLFYIYPTDKFLKYSQEYLKTQIDEQTIIEVGEIILDNSKKNIVTEFDNESFYDNSTETEESDNENVIGDIDETDSYSDIEETESI